MARDNLTVNDDDVIEIIDLTQRIISDDGIEAHAAVSLAMVAVTLSNPKMTPAEHGAQWLRLYNEFLKPLHSKAIERSETL